MASMSHHIASTVLDYNARQSPTKHRFPLSRPDEPSDLTMTTDTSSSSMNSAKHVSSRSRHDFEQDRFIEETEGNITISSTGEMAKQAVAPFLHKHIPAQYNPQGDRPQTANSTKYCYRHRPDMKCRRQVNEPSMEQLQHVRIFSRV